MKKKIIIPVAFALVVVSLAFIVEKSSQFNPMKQLGQVQELDNTTTGQKDFKIKKSGYYDITRIRGLDSEYLSRVPKTGQTFVGQYFDKGESMILSANQKVVLTPAKFAKVSEENGEVKLKDIGNYLIGEQFPSGRYTISLDGTLPEINDKEGTKTASVIQVVITTPGKSEETGSFELSNEKREIDFKLEDKKFLTIKSNGVDKVSIKLKK